MEDFLNGQVRKPHLLIAGAGIAGLTAALALLRSGFDIDVYEQAGELGNVGAGIQISPNGTRVLHALGVGEELRLLASEPEGKEVRLWNTGQSWKLFDLGSESLEKYGFPYLTTYRPDLHKVLADAVRREKPDAIHLDAKCIGLTQTDDGVSMLLANGHRVGGDALVGADGVHSQVRKVLLGDDSPSFSGCIAWRGVIPADRLPEHLVRPVGTNWIGPGGHVVHYPLHRGELMNFVGIVERDDWQVESWAERGTREECARDYEGWHQDVHTLIGNIETPYKWALMVRAPLAQWTSGRVTLMGDACHPTLPFLAQGAVMALEDGLVLARALAKYPRNINAAFTRYEIARRERTGRIVLGSAENAKRFHNSALSDGKAAGKYVDEEWNEVRVRQRYDWLFRYDATTVEI